MGFFRRVSVLTLVVTLSLIGIPLPAHAEGGESLPLTINGLPLSNADGAFLFTGLQASDYLVEVLVDDQVIASASLTLAEGVMQVGGVTLSQPMEEGGRRVGLWVGIGAGVGTERGGPHPLDRFSSQLRWNPVHDSSDLGLTGTGA